MRSMPIALRTLNANNYRKNLQKSKIKERLLLENFQINPLILKI